MSRRGVFNFHTEVNPQFSEIGKQDSSSDPDFLYYNGSIINNSTNTTKFVADPTAEYQDTRSLPILKDKSKYAVSVENFTLNGAGKVLPLFIPQIRQYLGNTQIPNTNCNNTIYDVTFTWQYTLAGVPKVFQSTRTVQWQPQNQAPWTVLPPNPYSYPQPEIDYYYCYSYSWWLKLVNTALEMAWSDVKLAVETFSPDVLFGTKCPYYTYDEKINLFSLFQDSNTCLVPYGDIPGSPPSTAGPVPPASPPNPQDVYGAASDSSYSPGEYSFVGWNTNWDNLLSNFNSVYYSSGVPYPQPGILGTRISSPLGTETSVQANEQTGAQQNLITSFVGNSLTFVPRTSSLGVTISKFVIGFPTILTQSVAIPSATTTTLNLNIGLVGSSSLVVGQTYVIYSVGNTNWTTLGSADNEVGTQFVATGYAASNKTGNATGLLQLSNVSYLRAGMTLLANGNPIFVESLGTTDINVHSLDGDLSAKVWTLTFPSMTSSSVTTAGTSMLVDIGSYSKYPLLTSGLMLDAKSGSLSSKVEVQSYVENVTLKSISVAGDTQLYYSGTPYSFGPVSMYNTQNGQFNIGDIVEGQSSGTKAEIISVIGSNPSSTNATPVTLVYSGQKNIFQIGDVIEDTVTGATGTIANVIGENTGYATLSFIQQDGSFGNNEIIVSYDPVFGLGGATIISVTGENTGYANCSYINEKDPVGGLASIFTSGEYLTFDNNGNVEAFAQVIQDNPQVTTSSGNEGYVQVKMINPDIANYLTGGTLIVTGSLSGTQCDLQGVNYPGTGTLLLNNISGSFYVGNTITDKIGETTVTAKLQNFSYLSGGTLTLTDVHGTFGINNQINSLSPGPKVNPVFALGSVSGSLSVNDVITNGTGSYATISNVAGEIQGTQIIQVSEVSGTFAPGDSITNLSPYTMLGLTGASSIYGVLNIGDTVYDGATGATGTGTVKSLVTTKINIFSIDTPTAGEIYQTSDFQTKFTVVSYSSPNLIVTDVHGSLQLGQSLVGGSGKVIQIKLITSQSIELNQVEGTFPSSGILGCGSPLAKTQYIYYSGLTGNAYNGKFNIGDQIQYGTSTATIAGITSSRLYLNSMNPLISYEASGIVNAITSSNIYLSIYVGTNPPVFGFQTSPVSIDDIFLYNDRYLTVVYAGGQETYGQDGFFVKQFICLSNASGISIPGSQGTPFGPGIGKVRYPSVKYPPGDPATSQYLCIDASVDLAVQASFIWSNLAPVPLQYTITSAAVTQTTGDLLLTSSEDTFANAITQTYSLGAGAVVEGGLVLKELTGSGFEADETIKDLKTLATAVYQTTANQIITCVTSGATGQVTEDNGEYLTIPAISQVPQLGEQIISSVSSKGLVTDWSLFPEGSSISSSAGWVASVLNSSFNTLQLELLSGYPALNDELGYNFDGLNTALIKSIDNQFVSLTPGLDGSGWTLSFPSLTSEQNKILLNPTTISTDLSDIQTIFSTEDMMTFNLVKEVAQQVQLLLPENVAAVEVPQCKYQQLVPGPAFVNGPLSSPAWYLVMVQDFESTSSLWSPVASIVIATTFITVREEYSGTPITLGTGNLGGNATTSSFQKVLLEVPIEDLPQTGLKGLIQYKPNVETLSSLGSSHSELKNIDVLFQWRNRLTNSLTPLQLSNSGSATIRLLFKKIRD
jgi:hypothetical protein